jgi:hypothetical protein
LVSKKTISIFAAAFGGTLFSVFSPGSVFKGAFFSLLTYTLQFKTSKYKRLASFFFGVQTRYPFNLLGRLFAGFNDPGFQVGREHSRHEGSCSRGKSPGWVNHGGRLTVPRRWVPLVFSWSHGRYDTGRPFPFPSFFFWGGGRDAGAFDGYLKTTLQRRV